LIASFIVQITVVYPNMFGDEIFKTTEDAAENTEEA
jgi:hypothetical protein